MFLSMKLRRIFWLKTCRTPHKQNGGILCFFGVCGYRIRPLGGILSLLEATEQLRGLERATKRNNKCVKFGDTNP